MTHPWDEFSKSLAEAVPRRESLRRLGAVFAGAALAPLSSGLRTAWARGQDPCKAFCQCRNKAQQNQCLSACRTCNGNTSRLAGSCGNYTCCAVASCKGVCTDLRSNPNCGACGNDCRAFGQTCCGNYCANLASDVDNCGGCGNVCDPPGPYEEGACIEGTCLYRCVSGASLCNGICTDLDGDPNNCGTCGHACGGSTPLCIDGTCSSNPCVSPFITCGGVCVDSTSDRDNCGGCGQVCPEGEVCSGGWCCNPDCTPDNPSYPNCGTVCGDPCLSLWTGLTRCGASCVDLSSDPYNCGACGNVCEPGFVCSSGACWDPACQFNDC